MSTRSTIGIESEDKTIKAIYCHCDGYPNGVGKILMNHYTTKIKVLQLIELGPISSLRESTQDTQDYYTWKNEDKEWNQFKSKDEYLSYNSWIPLNKVLNNE